ncbi:MAG TPA: hypothetical protein VFE70_04215, partial [Candidatus Elarobacter sp.]|nr:hypothetical protein [Candidatus Elarobacter sp.]
QTGAWIGSDWTILAGLKSGDRVIVDNLLKVRPGSVVTPTLQQDSTNAAIPGAAGAPAPAR